MQYAVVYFRAVDVTREDTKKTTLGLAHLAVEPVLKIRLFTAMSLMLPFLSFSEWLLW